MLVDGKHFRVSEFACHDGTAYPEEWADRWAKIVGLCDAIRDLWGAPLYVVSGYRSPEHNADLIAADEGRGAHGVASSSQHIEGNAADLRPASASEVPVLWRVVRQAQADGKLPALGGLGLYPLSCWIHVDTYHAADGHLRLWTGS
jgi:uncharacterized protein YcbK (DUF882 family)